VVPLVVAKGAGAEMRHTLGVAVFSGMLGVTIFRHILHAGVLLRHPMVHDAAASQANAGGRQAEELEPAMGGAHSRRGSRSGSNDYAS